MLKDTSHPERSSRHPGSSPRLLPSFSTPVIEPLVTYLDGLVATYETPAFIPDDPIAIPHGFDDPRDREIIGLYAALLAWGRRSTILSKMAELCERMSYRPFEFVRTFSVGRDGHRLAGFKHRTFQPDDALWLTQNLHMVLERYGTIENLCFSFMTPGYDHVGPAIQGFSDTVSRADPNTPSRLEKHLARPSTGSACKRLCMYLRWMVRPGPVDFGIWTSFQPAQLVLPLDVHSGRTARLLGLISRPINDWRAALELTETCRRFRPDDPCRYDYAFFGPAVQGTSVDVSLIVSGQRISTIPPSARNARS